VEELRIEIKRVRPSSLSLPAYMTEGAAGMDLCADVEVPIEIAPAQRVLIPTGIAIALPVGFEAQIRPRSGLALKHGMALVNSPGTIDSDYRGEIRIPLINLDGAPQEIAHGERIAQMLVARVVRIAWEPAESLPDTERGAGGFGSTGR